MIAFEHDKGTFIYDSYNRVQAKIFHLRLENGTYAFDVQTRIAKVAENLMKECLGERGRPESLYCSHLKGLPFYREREILVTRRTCNSSSLETAKEKREFCKRILLGQKNTSEFKQKWSD